MLRSNYENLRNLTKPTLDRYNRFGGKGLVGFSSSKFQILEVEIVYLLSLSFSIKLHFNEKNKQHTKTTFWWEKNKHEPPSPTPNVGLVGQWNSVPLRVSAENCFQSLKIMDENCFQSSVLEVECIYMLQNFLLNK